MCGDVLLCADLLLRADILLRAYVLLCAHVLGEHGPSRDQVMLSDGIIRLYRRWAREQQNSANDGGRETCDRRDARTNRIRATNATLSWASGRLTEYLRHARWARARGHRQVSAHSVDRLGFGTSNLRFG